MTLWSEPRRICALIGCFAALSLLAGARAGQAEERDLTRVIYDYAVTSYCGTLDRDVERGFRVELESLTRQSRLDTQAARQQRLKGWVQADREWSNRGLGGFRAWCRDEGLAASRHFRAIAAGDKEP